MIAFGLILDSLKSKSQPQSALLFCPGAQIHKLSLLLTSAQYMSIINCSHTIAILLERLRSQRKKVPICLPLKEWLEGLPEKPLLASHKTLKKRPKTLGSSSRHVVTLKEKIQLTSKNFLNFRYQNFLIPELGTAFMFRCDFVMTG